MPAHPPACSHQHVYERIHPNWNGTVVSLPSGPNNTYTNPGAPLYIVAANSGAVLNGNKFITPLPSWEAAHVYDKYGFGRMWVQGGTASDSAKSSTVGALSLRGSASDTAQQPGGTIFFQLADTDGTVQDTWTLVKG